MLPYSRIHLKTSVYRDKAPFFLFCWNKKKKKESIEELARERERTFVIKQIFDQNKQPSHAGSVKRKRKAHAPTSTEVTI